MIEHDYRENPAVHIYKNNFSRWQKRGADNTLRKVIG